MDKLSYKTIPGPETGMKSIPESIPGSIVENGLRRLGLYIHIPFCVKKCGYCDFLSAPADEETVCRYFDALQSEVKSYAGRTKEYYVPTIFIGGGTPSAVDASHIKSLLNIIRETFQVGDGNEVMDVKYIHQHAGHHADGKWMPEITIEINPGTVDKEKLLAYQEAGINRLSFGLQTVKDEELKLLGRIHTYRQFEDNYYLAREMGFQNINIDLISALPGQTLQSWEDTMRKTAGLNPEHISAYSLIIEEGTPFYGLYGQGGNLASELPDEDTDRMIYQRTKEFLEESGYHRYEISNYAKEGFRCEHNISYWTGIEYLGLGLGSASLTSNQRFHNTAALEEYIESCKEYCIYDKNARIGHDAIKTPQILIDSLGIRREIDPLTVQNQMEEFMFLGLRMTDGVSRKEFRYRFHADLDVVYGGIIDRLAKEGLIYLSGDKIALTEYGTDISNRVLADFLFE